MRDFVDRWWHGREPILGIDICDTGVVVADVNLRGKNRWRRADASSPSGGGSGALSDMHELSELLRDFISDSPTRLYRCAVAFPESLTSFAWVTLPDEMVDKPEEVRYEAALDRAYLRPQDVRGRVCIVKRSGAEGPNALLIVAKASDVAILEDSVALAGLEVAYLTPRVFALHHLVLLAGLPSKEELFAYLDPSAYSPVFHLFQGARYHSTVRGLGEFVREIERYVEHCVLSRGPGGITLLSEGDDRNAQLLQERYPLVRSLFMGELALPGKLTLDPQQVVAASLSLVEARTR